MSDLGLLRAHARLELAQCLAREMDQDIPGWDAIRRRGANRRRGNPSSEEMERCILIEHRIARNTNTILTLPTLVRVLR